MRAWTRSKLERRARPRGPPSRSLPLPEGVETVSPFPIPSTLSPLSLYGKSFGERLLSQAGTRTLPSFSSTSFRTLLGLADLEASEKGTL